MKRRNFFLGLTAAVVGAALELRLATALPDPLPPPAYLSKATLDQLYQRLIAEAQIVEGQMVSMIITDAKAHHLLLQDHIKTK